MLNKIFAEMRGIQVVWKGTAKGKDPGGNEVQVPQCQCMMRSPEGKMETLYMKGNGAVSALSVGDIIDAQVEVKAYKDGLYLNLLNSKPHQEERRPAK